MKAYLKEPTCSRLRVVSVYVQLLTAVCVTGAMVDDVISAPQTELAFAKVGDAVITQKEYDDAFNLAVKRTFYHGKPPQDQVAALQREVGDKLVNSVLLLREAKRRALKPDHAAIAANVKEYDERYRRSEQWQQNRAQLLPQLKRRLEEESVLGQLEAQVRSISPPGAAAVQAFYVSHPEKFTEPEQLHLSVVLLNVDPSSPKVKWDAARTEALNLVKKLRAGADFARLARLHSGDSSAAAGGDMGYVHRGMLPGVAQQAIDKLKAGGISEPVTVLEGVAVFRLDERKPASLANVKKVHGRARELWLREQSEIAWRGLIEQLRSATKITLDESRYLPLASADNAKRVTGKH